MLEDGTSSRRVAAMRDATASRSPRPGRGRAGNNAECVRAVAAPGPRPECGRCGATVADGLVPSLADAAAGPCRQQRPTSSMEGEDKPRPYGSLADAAAVPTATTTDKPIRSMEVSSPGPGRGRAGNNAECVPAVAAPGPRPECGRCGATVADGLVPSLADAAAVTSEGEDKPRPYGPLPTATTDKPIRSMRAVAGTE